MSMNPRKKFPARSLVVVFALGVLAVLVLGMASKPVLLEVGTRTAILNPLRSRAPERTAEAFLSAASNAECSPDLSEDLCRFVKKRPLSAREWRLVNRQDSAKDIKLYYRLGGDLDDRRKSGTCVIAQVHVERDGATWRTYGYGVQPGPCNGRWRP